MAEVNIENLEGTPIARQIECLEFLFKNEMIKETEKTKMQEYYDELLKYNKLRNQRNNAAKKYRIKNQHTPEWKNKRKEYYNNNLDKIREKGRNFYKKYYDNEDIKEKKKQYYNDNKELIKIKAQYRYFKKNNKEEYYKEKYNDNYNKLCELNYIKI